VLDAAGNVVVDPVTNLVKLQPTWENYMTGKTVAGFSQVIYQSVVLVKKHAVRKAACDFVWCPDPLPQVGMVFDADGVFVKSNINTHWPLAFETDGTTFTLTVTYSTDKSVALPGAANYRPSRVHTEVYVWKVVDNTWADLALALRLFYALPAGQCELAMITSDQVLTQFNWFINGTPAQNGKVAILGIQSLIQAGKVAEANARFGQLEEYIDSVCWSGCGSASSCTQPSPAVVGIINTPSAPVASILLNDVWAIGKAQGILID